MDQAGPFSRDEDQNPVFTPGTVYVASKGVRSTIAEVIEMYPSEQRRLGRDKPITSEDERQGRKQQYRISRQSTMARTKSRS